MAAKAIVCYSLYELVQWKTGFDETLSPWLDTACLDPDTGTCMIAKFERYMVNQHLYVYKVGINFL